jgi:hypothetical protein
MVRPISTGQYLGLVGLFATGGRVENKKKEKKRGQARIKCSRRHGSSLTPHQGPAKRCKAFWLSCSFLLSFAIEVIATTAVSTCAKAHLSIHSRQSMLLGIFDAACPAWWAAPVYYAYLKKELGDQGLV